MAGFDVIVVGSGPNGLAAAIVFARSGLRTLVLERGSTPGGGARSEELTLPGFVHDTCSAVHPLAFASPFFRRLSLEAQGLARVDSPAPLAHALAPDETVLLERSVAATARGLGADEAAYREVVEPFVDEFDALSAMILGPLRRPERPFLLGRFGLLALRSARGFAHSTFRTREARALFAGMAAHAMLPLESAATASFGLVLGLAGHAVGWPLARGGSQSITTALVRALRAFGGELELERDVRSLRELPPARAYVLDVTPRQLLAMTSDELGAAYRSRLARYRYGPGVYKMDWALSAPVPWRDTARARAATVHIGGDFDDVASATAAPHENRVAMSPFVLFAQPSLFDASRAPAGSHTAWAYCHVPNGSSVELANAIESVIERHAPGFRDIVLGRSIRNPAAIEAYDPNYVGGDINGGAAVWTQLFTRPVARFDPYATSVPDVFLCSSSTPPGGGVHGMCGYFAAKSVLRKIFGRSLTADIDITRPL